MKKAILFIIFLLTFCSISYGYTDISSNHWAYNEIKSLTDDKILTGYPGGDFKPEEKMTKAEFMTILSKVLGLNVDVSSVSGHWAQGYINSLSEENIIDFSEYSKFEPDSFITRWEICKMIVNSFENTKNMVLNSKIPIFSDIDTLNTEEQRIAKILKDIGILSGYPDGTVRFNDTSTRAEVSSFIYNLRNKWDEIKFYGEIVIYEDNVAVSRIENDSIKLRKYEFAEDKEYSTTIISSIKMFEFDKASENGYKDVFEQIYNEKHPYLSYRNKFGKGNYVLAIDFKTRNNTKEYDILAGYPFLHVFFENEEDIKIIDAFDIDEINMQVNNEPYVGEFVKPGETQNTSAFYVINKLPKEKFYINRSITTLYDNKNMKNVDVNSFHSVLIYI